MAFRFVRGIGDEVSSPSTVLMYASGTIHRGGIVIYDVANNAVSPATSTAATTTNIFGVSMDYAQGASDTLIRVVPFVQGQLWEADTNNAISTLNILLRHGLYDDVSIKNTTGGTGLGTKESATTGVFLCLGVVGATTGSGRIIGTFLQRAPMRADSFALT